RLARRPRGCREPRAAHARIPGPAAGDALRLRRGGAPGARPAGARPGTRGPARRGRGAVHGALRGAPARCDAPLPGNRGDARAAPAAFCGAACGLTPESLAAAAPERMIEHPAELLDVVERG